MVFLSAESLRQALTLGPPRDKARIRHATKYRRIAEAVATTRNSYSRARNTLTNVAMHLKGIGTALRYSDTPSLDSHLGLVHPPESQSDDQVQGRTCGKDQNERNAIAEQRVSSWSTAYGAGP